MYSRPGVMKGYATALFKAWKVAEGGTRIQLEQCLQDHDGAGDCEASEMTGKDPKVARQKLCPDPRWNWPTLGLIRPCLDRARTQSERVRLDSGRGRSHVAEIAQFGGNFGFDQIWVVQPIQGRPNLRLRSAISWVGFSPGWAGSDRTSAGFDLSWIGFAEVWFKPGRRRVSSRRDELSLTHNLCGTRSCFSGSGLAIAVDSGVAS